MSLTPKYTQWEAIGAAIEIATKALEEVRVLARLPGPPGEAGLGFDDLSIEHDGERSFTFRLARNGRVKEFPFTVPVVIDRGVYKDGGTYQRGDGVTFAGSFWIAQEETSEKPNSGKGWRLAVKRGSDGKDGKDSGPSNGTPPVKIG